MLSALKAMHDTEGAPLSIRAVLDDRPAARQHMSFDATAPPPSTSSLWGALESGELTCRPSNSKERVSASHTFSNRSGPEDLGGGAGEATVGGGVGVRSEIQAKWSAAREAASHQPHDNGCRGC